MDFNTDAIKEVFFQVDWGTIFIATVAGYLLCMIWYGFLFRRQWMELAGKSMGEKTNIPAMIVQFFALFAMAYFIAFLTLAPPSVFWIVLGSFVDVALISMLAGAMFMGTDNIRALKLWGINGGCYLTQAVLITAVILSLL